MKKIMIFLFSVMLTMNCVTLAAQAEAPTDFRATRLGTSFACRLSWSNPMITGIIKIVLEREGEIIKEFENTNGGYALDFTDSTIPGYGVYEYAVYAVTAAGNGEKAYATIHFRSDVCNFKFLLWDDIGFGWNPVTGIEITVDEIDYGFVNLARGTAYAEVMVALPS